MKKVRDDLSDHKQDVAKNYVQKSDYKDDVQRIYNLLQNISDKLDSKADKGHT